MAFSRQQLKVGVVTGGVIVIAVRYILCGRLTKYCGNHLFRVLAITGLIAVIFSQAKINLTRLLNTTNINVAAIILLLLW